MLISLDEVYRAERPFEISSLESPNANMTFDRTSTVISSNFLMPPFKYGARISALMTFRPASWFNLFEIRFTDKNTKKMSSFFRRVGHFPISELLMKREKIILEVVPYNSINFVAKLIIPYMFFNFFEFRSKYLGESDSNIAFGKAKIVQQALAFDWVEAILQTELPRQEKQTKKTPSDLLHILTTDLPSQNSCIFHVLLFLAIEGLGIPSHASNSLRVIDQTVRELCKRPKLAFTYETLVSFFGVYELAIRKQHPELWHFKRVQTEINARLNSPAFRQEDIEDALSRNMGRLVYSKDRMQRKDSFAVPIEAMINNPCVDEELSELIEASPAQPATQFDSFVPESPIDRPLGKQSEKDIVEEVPEDSVRGRLLSHIFPVSTAIGEVTSTHLKEKVDYAQTLVIDNSKFNMDDLLIELTSTREFCQIFHPSSFKQLVEAQLKKENLSHIPNFWIFPVMFDFIVQIGDKTIHLDVDDEYKRFYNFPVLYVEERLKKLMAREREIEHIVMTKEEFLMHKGGLEEWLKKKVGVSKQSEQ